MIAWIYNTIYMQICTCSLYYILKKWGVCTMQQCTYDVAILCGVGGGGVGGVWGGGVICCNRERESCNNAHMMEPYGWVWVIYCNREREREIYVNMEFTICQFPSKIAS